MCGRFVRGGDSTDYKEAFGVDFPVTPPSYNVAPTQSVLAVRLDRSEQPHGVSLRWGLVPSWADDSKIVNSLINARAETVATKPAYRAAFKKRRCLIVADGYYEWKASGKKKQPYLFRLKGGEPFAFAGLWEFWERDGEVIESCALITTDPNDLGREVHDRMPVLLGPEAREEWLDPAVDAGALRELLVPFPAERMEAWPVSPAVNSPRNNGPELTRPLAL